MFIAGTQLSLCFTLATLRQVTFLNSLRVEPHSNRTSTASAKNWRNPALEELPVPTLHESASTGYQPLRLPPL